MSRETMARPVGETSRSVRDVGAVSMMRGFAPLTATAWSDRCPSSPAVNQISRPDGLQARPRAFAHSGGDAGPAWRDFTDPLDAIAARFRPEAQRRALDRFTARERHALGILGLNEDTDLHRVRKRYSELVRRYHPDRNGGDRSYESKLGQVLEAWQTLKTAKAFA